MGSEDKSDSPQTNTGKHWTLEEHDLLLALKGAGETWQDISERLERTPQACQDQYLQAKLGTKWTEEEDKLLFTLKEAVSDKTWQEISDHLPGRTVNSCRAHYNVVLHRGWGHEEENKLARLYESRKAENEMSAKIGQELKLPWEEAEEMHWRLGAEGMAKRAGAANLSPAPRQPVQTTDEQFANGSRLAMSEDELMACMAELLDETAFAPSNDLESSNEYGS
ncbi:related to DRPLA protein [Claviceps purpurea 20.1]|uniref:Related to DRPLA protein n=1 Tax=Claviceps purpurea (strain 20.1) TaxID=1111077 RepID=M1VZX9_CLAP2|nr:related to DRPLA protein [Claviceps purpurea 20.1]